ncbi:MAG: 3-keto-5-aminohexanoate cleavage protein [Chloroflexi bacterium]|nr:3-keto-5-aminohexanoate cleavage protein [Chloroflexota bacterium]MDA1218901.1 3-keto-5-aminohexanoate cleavage protein [Chloroflexota bacterium]
MDTIIIKACLNGGRGREHNPNVPWTPVEVAQEAIRCYDAGASIVHFHARNSDGSISYDPEWYAETDGLIRAQCDLVLNHTTARQSSVPVEVVTRYLAETPLPVEMVSLNLGYGVRWPADPETGQRRTSISPNSYEDITATLDACYRRGTFPEPAVHDMGDLNNAITLMREGQIKSTRYFLVEPSAHCGDGRQSMVGTPRNYFAITDNILEFYPEATWLAHSSGTQTFVLCSIAIVTGAHVRVGFEDSPCLPNNSQPKSNADFIEWAVTTARLNGREPATPEQARDILGLLPAP